MRSTPLRDGHLLVTLLLTASITAPISALTPVPTTTQEPVATMLPPANGRAGEFTRIRSVRELPDGRVLVVDPRSGGSR